MLDSLRKASGTWIVKIFLALLAISFMAWNLGDYFGAKTSEESIITAGKTRVTAKDYLLFYQQQLNVFSAMSDRPLTPEIARSFGLHHRVLDFMVGGAVLDEKVRLLKLALPKEVLIRLIAKDSVFHNENGQFDRERFEQTLDQMGIKHENYLKTRNDSALRQQIVAPLSDGIKIPKIFMEAFVVYQKEKRSFDYLVIPLSLVDEIKNPEEKTIIEWFNKNRSLYALPERRTISFVKLEPEDIIDFSTITDEKIIEEYKKNGEQFIQPEKRKIQQLIFPSLQRAESAKNSLIKGENFEKIVTDNGKTISDINLGELAYDQIIDKKIADVAFSMKPESVGNVVEGSFGFALIRVLSITPEKITPIEEVREKIRKEIALREATEKLHNVYNAYEKGREGGLSLQQAALDLGLKVTTLDSVDMSGKNAEGQISYEAPFMNDLLSLSFKADSGVENPALELDSGYLFYEVSNVYPKEDRHFTELKDKAIQDWKDSQKILNLAKKVDQITKNLRDGTSMDSIAKKFFLEKKTLKKVVREQLTKNKTFGALGTQALFSTPKGHVGAFPDFDKKSWILFKVEESIPPESLNDQNVSIKEANEILSQQFSSDFINYFIEQLRNEYNPKVDYDMMERVLSF